MLFYGTRYSVPRKMCKFRLSRNSTKFDMVAIFRETIPTVKSVLSSEIYKNFGFLPKLSFWPFFENWNFLGSHMGYSPPKCTCHRKKSHSRKYVILLECLHAQSHVSSPHRLPHTRLSQMGVKYSFQNKSFLFSETYY